MRKQSLKGMKKSPAVRTAGKSVAVRSGSLRSKSLISRKPPRVFEWFVSKETPTTKKIHMIREGVGARVVDDMVEYLKVPKNVIFTVLHTAESTAHRLIKDNRNLDSAASERVVRVADITRIAKETFGGRERATEWLTRANRALADVTPLSMLDTEPGAGEVRRILSSINYGGVF